MYVHQNSLITRIRRKYAVRHNHIEYNCAKWLVDKKLFGPHLATKADEWHQHFFPYIDSVSLYTYIAHGSSCLRWHIFICPHGIFFSLCARHAKIRILHIAAKLRHNHRRLSHVHNLILLLLRAATRPLLQWLLSDLHIKIHGECMWGGFFCSSGRTTDFLKHRTKPPPIDSLCCVHCTSVRLLYRQSGRRKKVNEHKSNVIFVQTV